MPSRSLMTTTIYDPESLCAPGLWRRAFPDLAIYCEVNHIPEYEANGFLTLPHTITLAENIDALRRSEPDEPAEAWDAPEIPNGDWVIEHAGETFYFRTYLVTQGTLAGKRVVKRRDGTRGIYKGFAFITRDGGLRMWRNHAHDEDAEYVRFMRRAIMKISDENRNPQHMEPHRCGYQRFSMALEDIDRNVLSGVAANRISIRVRHACSLCNVRDHVSRGSNETPMAFCNDHQTVVPDPSEEEMRAAEAREREVQAQRNLSRLPLCELGTGQVL